MAALLSIVNEQFGRILLAVTIAWVIAVTAQNRPPELAPILQADKDRSVQVLLDMARLPTAIKEQYFMPVSTGYTGDERCIFVPEIKLAEFKPVRLDVPSSNVQPPPQLLPEPGPLLESTSKLPRFGDEFPPLKLDDPKAKDSAPVPKP